MGTFIRKKMNPTNGENAHNMNCAKNQIKFQFFYGLAEQ